MTNTQRIQTWLADHFSGVQYPNIKAVTKDEKVQIDVPTQIIVTCFSIVVLLAGLALAGFGLVIFWVLLTAIFS